MTPGLGLGSEAGRGAEFERDVREGRAGAWIVDPVRTVMVSVSVSDSATASASDREVPRCVRDDGSELAVGSCGYEITTATPDYVDTPAPPPPPAPMTGSGMMDGVTVYSTAAVGPYETVVLGAATAAEVTTWLREHGYRVPSATARLLEPYVTQGYVFVALRLRANRVSSVLRPVVLRTPAPADGGIAEACLPIRLTPVASASTLPITAFFLADQLVTPLNYSLVELDLVDAALYGSPRTYAARVARGADALGGHGFAVDYAGRMPRLGILHPSVSDLAEESDPGEFLREINRRGYMGDRILQDLLEAYMPPPTGELPATYYNCLVAGLATCGAPRSFDPARLAAAIESEITAPRAEAEALLQRHVRLTRLSTELSPPEMTIDPVFVRDEHLPEVSNRHPAARVIRCGPAYFPGQAPEDLVIGDRTIPLSAGLGSTDADYCATFGAMVATGRASTRARECGYSGCSVGAGSRPTPLLLLTLLSAAWLLRRRRA